MPSTQHQALLQQLAATSQGFLQSFDGLSDEQWNWKPSAGTWSVRETAEHVTIVMRRITHTMTKSILSQPLPPPDDKPRISDSFIIATMFDRSIRRPAPEPVLPAGRWASQAECRAAYDESDRELREWIGDLSADLRQYGFLHPAMGLLDGIQWLIFLNAHTERHTRQVEEIRGQFSPRA